MKFLSSRASVGAGVIRTVLTLLPWRGLSAWDAHAPSWPPVPVPDSIWTGGIFAHVLPPIDVARPASRTARGLSAFDLDPGQPFAGETGSGSGWPLPRG
jgi:hypothetical protein